MCFVVKRSKCNCDEDELTPLDGFEDDEDDAGNDDIKNINGGDDPLF